MSPDTENADATGHNSGETVEIKDKDYKLRKLTPEDEMRFKSLVADLEAQMAVRATVNTAVAEIKANIEEMGFNFKGVEQSMRYINASEKVQNGYDLSIKISRDLLGMPLQADLFDVA